MTDQQRGQWLVALQFLALLALAALGARALRGMLMADAVPAVPVAAASALALMAVALGVWSLTAHPIGTFRIHPIPRENGRLITHGPYRWIRHPMYTSLLLVAAAVLAVDSTTLAVIAALMLALVLDSKARFEETLLCRQFANYGDYAARTWRFVPFVY